MKDEIVNRVANSPLVTFDLEEFYPDGKRIALDISPWLWQGMVVKEKEFRNTLEHLDVESFTDSYVVLHCSTDAIIPAWAYLLVSVRLSPIAKKVIVGSLQEMETLLFSELIDRLDFSSFANKPVIIKGCSNKPIPQNAYLLLAQKLQPIVKSIMYGEACSSVPLYKKK